MRDRLLSRWRGIALSLIGVVAIVWLAATGQLGLYIHPRYFEFTVVMAVLAGVVVIAAFAVVPSGRADARGHDDGHGHGDSHEGGEHGHAHPSSRLIEPASASAPSPSESSRRPRGLDLVWAAAGVLVIVGTVVALLVVPPSTLTTATVDQRDLNASAAVTDTGATENLVGSDTASFTVKDWASLLRQGAGEDYFAGKGATLTGFVTPDQSDPENVFYIARFIVTCCAVDAQPVGVPVYLPDWQNSYAVDSWVTASGGFESNPSTTSTQTIAFVPAEIEAVAQPAQPYLG